MQHQYLTRFPDRQVSPRWRVRVGFLQGKRGMAWQGDPGGRPADHRSAKRGMPSPSEGAQVARSDYMSPVVHWDHRLLAAHSDCMSPVVR